MSCHVTAAEYAEGDVVWDDSSVIKYPAVCVAAGIMAGM